MTRMGHKEKLLAGAKQCLYEKGWSRTTARDIVAASGTNLASIGYHYGSKEALLTAAMMDAFGEWAGQLDAALAAESDGGPLDRLEARLTRLVESFTTHRPLWLASFEAFSQAEHSPELRKQLADGYELHARPDLAGKLLGLEPDAVDAETARTVGSLLVAVQAGLAAQWLLDPEHAPSGADMVEALRTIAGLVEPARA
jgi:AcrR family transcriptional regulator